MTFQSVLNEETWIDGRPRPQFPIDESVDHIRYMLDVHQVVVVGSEISAHEIIRIAQGVLLGGDFRVWLIQPRRSAVRWTGMQIAYELGCQPGEQVGWRLPGEEPVESRDTRLHIRVDRAFINPILDHISDYSGALPPGVFMIDATHERSVHLDVLLGLIREALPKSPDTRVLITSTTIDAMKFSKFFAGAPMVKVPGQHYPVRTEVVRLEYKHSGELELHTDGAIRAATIVLERFLNGTLIVPNASGSGSHIVTKGTVLVLLPGKKDIDQAMAELSKVLQSAIKATTFESSLNGDEPHDRVEILSYHGEPISEVQDTVHRPLADRVLRFVCGTEYLRTGITILDIIGVVDSLEVNRFMVDSNGVAHLKKMPISRMEADQSRSLAGRMEPGLFMPVSLDNEYETLDPHRVPAVMYSPIRWVALQVASIGRSIRQFPWIDAPESDKVEAAIQRLTQIGALDENGGITQLGKVLMNLPLDPERGKVLITANQLDVLPEAVIVAATLEAQTFFSGPKADLTKVQVDQFLAQLLIKCASESAGSQSDGLPYIDLSGELPMWLTEFPGGLFEVDLVELARAGFAVDPINRARFVSNTLRRHWAGSSHSDFSAIVRAYRAFKAEERRLASHHLSPSALNRNLIKWCIRYFISYHRISLVGQIIDQILEDIASSGLFELGYEDIELHRKFNDQALIKALAAGLTGHVATRVIANSPHGVTYEGPLGRFHLAFTSAVFARLRNQPPLSVLTGGLYEVTTRNGTQLMLADLAAPFEL